MPRFDLVLGGALAILAALGAVGFRVWDAAKWLDAENPLLQVASLLALVVAWAAVFAVRGGLEASRRDPVSLAIAALAGCFALVASLTLVATLVRGIWPRRQARCADPPAVVGEGRRGRSGRRIRRKRHLPKPALPAAKSGGAGPERARRALIGRVVFAIVVTFAACGLLGVIVAELTRSRPAVTLLITDIFGQRSDLQPFGQAAIEDGFKALEQGHEAHIRWLEREITSAGAAADSLANEHGDAIVFGQLDKEYRGLRSREFYATSRPVLQIQPPPGGSQTGQDFRFIRRLTMDLQAEVALIDAHEGRLDAAVAVLNAMVDFSLNERGTVVLNTPQVDMPETSPVDTSELQLAARETAYATLLQICACDPGAGAGGTARRRALAAAIARRHEVPPAAPLALFVAESAWLDRPGDAAGIIALVNGSLQRDAAYGRLYGVLGDASWPQAVNGAVAARTAACSAYASYFTWLDTLKQHSKDKQDAWWLVISTNDAGRTQRRASLHCESSTDGTGLRRPQRDIKGWES